MKHLLLVLLLVGFCFVVMSCDLLKSDSDDDPAPADTSGAFEWVDVPTGDYTFGETSEVGTISYDYQIMKYEVTNAQYVVFLNEAIAAGTATVVFSGTGLADRVEGPYEGDDRFHAQTVQLVDLNQHSPGGTYEDRLTYSNGSFHIMEGYDDHPVVMTTWFGAHAFAKHYGYEIPTEQEWEKAARGNTGSIYPWGNTEPWDEQNVINCGLVNYGNCRTSGTSPVGATTGASPFGAYDMAGNVYEWCDSWLIDSGYVRVMKGGSWADGPYFTDMIYTYKRTGSASAALWHIGFRCVKRD